MVACENVEAYKMNVLPDNILRRMDTTDRSKLGKAGVTSSEAQEKCDAKSEKEIHRQIEQWLNLHGVVYIHSRTDRKTTNAVGLPDFIFAWPIIQPHSEIVDYGIPFAIEIKLPGKKPTKEQSDCITKMRQNGWHTAVAHSLREFIEIVQGDL